MRIEFIERFSEPYTEEELDANERMNIPLPKQEVKYRRVYIRMDDIFAPILIISLAIAIVILSTCNSCSNKKYEERIVELEGNLQSSKEDNPVQATRKLEIIAYERDSFYFPKPVAYIPKGYIHEKDARPELVFDTVEIDGPTEFIEVGCEDKLVFKDTIKNRFGYVVVTDTVTGNTIANRSVNWNLSIPKETVTNEKTIRKGMLYWGIDAHGNKSGINGVGVSLMYSSPKALNYEIGAMLGENTNGINYKAGVKIPLWKK
jgi:hypothetical protein